MLSIVDREPFDRVVSIEEGRAAEPPAPSEAAEESAEFEIVLGRRQMASVAFVATVLVVAFSAISYLAGKSAAPKPVVSAPEPAPVITLATPAEVVPQPAAPPANPKPEPAAAKAQPGAEAPLFADPKSGAVYLQLGAVEKGVAIIMAEGLRRREMGAFVAPGPNDHIFRVLIGPLDSESYKRVKETVDALGLSAFARKYQQ